MRVLTLAVFKDKIGSFPKIWNTNRFRYVNYADVNILVKGSKG